MRRPPGFGESLWPFPALASWWELRRADQELADAEKAYRHQVQRMLLIRHAEYSGIGTLASHALWRLAAAHNNHYPNNQIQPPDLLLITHDSRLAMVKTEIDRFYPNAQQVYVGWLNGLIENPHYPGHDRANEVVYEHDFFSRTQGIIDDQVRIELNTLKSVLDDQRASQD